MSKVLYKNECFKLEMLDDNTNILTILKDKNVFYGVNLENCSIIMNANGRTITNYTDDALNTINQLCSNDLERELLKLNLQINTLMESMNRRRIIY